MHPFAVRASVSLFGLAVLGAAGFCQPGQPPPPPDQGKGGGRPTFVKGMPPVGGPGMVIRLPRPGTGTGKGGGPKTPVPGQPKGGPPGGPGLGKGGPVGAGGIFKGGPGDGKGGAQGKNKGGPPGKGKPGQSVMGKKAPTTAQMVTLKSWADSPKANLSPVENKAVTNALSGNLLTPADRQTL